MAANFKKRLANLEKRAQSPNLQSTVLFFADGTTATLDAETSGRMLGYAACPESAGPGDAEKLALIRKSIASKEPGGSRLIELARAVMLSPRNESPEESPSEAVT